MDDNTALWLGLLLTPGLGQRGSQKLIEEFETPEAIYAASLTTLEACDIAPAVAQCIHSGRSAELGVAEAATAKQLGVEVVSRGDRRYPALLREIFDPPLLLYVRGEVNVLDTFAIALVGTRRPTLYGKLMAERLGRDLARWGLTVVSGMARGIDAAGQTACLEAGGRTVAVMGTGIDIVYPSEHRKLADEIVAKGGALVSEFPLGTVPNAQNFPIRNRVISGMALGVLVVEGGEFSGSRITARMALEQDREVFAVPGMVTQRQAWLPNALIKQGAKLVNEAGDVVEELPSPVRSRLEAPAEAVAVEKGKGPGTETGERQAILGVLPIDEGTHVDEIVNRLHNKLSAPETLAMLFDLELEGKIRQLPGKKYLRVS